MSMTARILEFPKPATTDVPVAKVGDGLGVVPPSLNLQPIKVAASFAGGASVKGLRLWWTLARHAPSGVARTTSTIRPWVTDVRGAVLCDTLRASVNEMDKTKTKALVRVTDKLTKAERLHRTKVRVRSSVLAVPTVGTVAGGAWAHMTMSTPVEVALGAAFGITTTTFFGAVASPQGHELVEKVKASRGISDKLILSALINLGISAMKDPEAIEFRAPVQGKENGWETIVQLPVNAGMVIDRHARFSANLHRSKDCVILSVGNSEDELVIEVTKHAPKDRKQGEWPLANVGQIDIFEPFPFGEDDMGNPVMLCLNENSLCITGRSRTGKSEALRTLFSTIVRDPRVEPWAGDFKGAGDLNEFAELCKAHVSGVAAVNDDVKQAGRWIVDEIQKEGERRAEILRPLPENKVTSELADRVPGLHPIVLILDEFQEILDAPTLAALKSLAKRVSAYGIFLVCATQSADKKVVPWELIGAFTSRMSFNSDSSTSNAMLGDDSATKLKLKGSCILQTLDGRESMRVYMTTRQQRLDSVAQSGIPRIESAPVADDAPASQRSIIHDIWATRNGDENGVWLEELPDRLREISDHWQHVDRVRIRKLLAAVGIEPRDVKKFDEARGKDRSPKGYHYELDIRPAMLRGDR